MVNSGIHSQLASDLYAHEKAHANADQERKGEFGFYVTGGWIVAYYLIKGERTPEQLMEIASAPGFSRMSHQDWNVYKNAWKELLNQVPKKETPEDEVPKEDYSDKDELKRILIEKLSKNLDESSERGDFPKLKDLLELEFTDLISEYGMLIYEAYRQAIDEVRNNP